MIKRVIGLMLVVVAIATMLTACGKFTCDICGEEKSGTKHESELLGESVEICDDCYDALEELANAIG